MTEIERINYLIEVFACGNAKQFADKCSIRPDSLSRVRNGKGSPSHFFPHILKALPDVRRDWLYNGEGRAFHSEAQKDILTAKIDTLTEEVRKLSELVQKCLKTP